MTLEHRVSTFVRRSTGVCKDDVLSDSQWREVLRFSDRLQLSLLLDRTGAPDWVQQQLRLRAAKNDRRHTRMWAAYREIDSEFRRTGIDFVVLKGFTHADYGIPAGARVQYDLDLLTAPSDGSAAVAALRRIGYKQHSSATLSDQHLAPMVKPSNWTWRDDYYDPDLPIPVEIHTCVWNDETDRIRLPGAAAFWGRRCKFWYSDRPLPALDPVDKLAFAALHTLRHILRNDARPASVLELGAALQSSMADPALWRRWALMHDQRLRAIQAVAFRFAAEWFAFTLPVEVAHEIDGLPRRVKAWFDDFAWSPIRNLSRSNKDVIWLHLALLDSVRDCVIMLRRRLVPLHASGDPREGRLSYHASALTPALVNGVRWWRRAAAASTSSQTRC